MKPLQAMVLRTGDVRHVQFRVVFARHGIPKVHTRMSLETSLQRIPWDLRKTTAGSDVRKRQSCTPDK